MAGFVPRVVSYIGVEVRLADCYTSTSDQVPNCACFEKLDPELKKSLRAVGGGTSLFCPVCQTPVDRAVVRKKLKFFSPSQAEVEAEPERHWPSVLNKASAERNGTSRGYRVFPVFDKGVVRRDVVMFGLPVWQSAGAYNGEFPDPPATAKYDEVKSWLSKMGLFNKDSFKLRLYFAQEPGSAAELPNTPLSKPVVEPKKKGE